MARSSPVKNAGHGQAVIRGSANIFADLGFGDAVERQVKLRLAYGLNRGDLSASPADRSGTSIFTALREQLGLKLEPVTAPVDVLVIESAQQPAEN
jgi:uncharacterized protein (TIGR03435 family)